jgi:hypothetical protein
MYWSVEDGDKFELMDGQQRTLSICEYLSGNFSVDFKYFHNLFDHQKEQILNYELTIYKCIGTQAEKLEWFKTINIYGEKLNDQELRNAIYTGSWVSDARRYFSKTGCLAFNIGQKYLKGTAIRQDYLETVIDWISKGEIENYMSIHQHHQSASDLVLYFRNVINWVEVTFPNYRDIMKGIDWGTLYNKYGSVQLNPIQLEKEIQALLLDEDVSSKSGVYEYILSRDERKLNIRAFNPKQKNETYTRQVGVCIKCTKSFTIAEMEADHITPWSLGGKTVLENCQMLCKRCNRTKSAK